MNMKKLVSSVAAFAMTASAFAGLATVANAAEYEVPYTLGPDEVIREVYLGTVNSEKTGVDVETFEGTVSGTLSGVAVNDSGRDATDPTNDIYVTGKALSIPKSGRTEYAFKKAATSGKIILRGDLFNPLRDEYVEIYGTNSSGETGNIFRMQAVNSSGNDWVYARIGKDLTTDNRIYIHSRNCGMTLQYAIIDLDAKTVTYKFDGVQYEKEGNAYTKPGAIQTASNSDVTVDVASVTGIAVGQANSSSGNNACFDNVALYAVGPEVATISKPIITAPYAKLVSAAGTVVYSDYLGKAIATEEEGAKVKYTITKGGYEAKEVEVEFNDGNAVTAALTPSVDGVLFNEDFESIAQNVGNGAGFYNTQNGSGNNNNWTRIQGNSWDKNLQYIGGGSSAKTSNAYLTYDEGSYDIYTLTYDVESFTENKDTNLRTTTVTALDANGNPLSTIAYNTDGDDHALVGMTVNGTEIEGPVATGTIEVKVNTVTGEATTTVCGTTSTITVENAAAPKTIQISLGRNHRYTIDNIKVTGEDLPEPDVEIVPAEYLDTYVSHDDPDAAAWAASVPADGFSTKSITWSFTVSDNTYTVEHDAPIVTGTTTVLGLIIQLDDGVTEAKDITDVKVIVE